MVDCVCGHEEHVFQGRCPVRNPCPEACCDDQWCECVRKQDVSEIINIPLCSCGHERTTHVGERYSCFDCSCMDYVKIK